MIFVSYASADDEDQSDVVRDTKGNKVSLSLIKRILFEVFKGNRVPGCAFSAHQVSRGIYFFPADSRTDPVNIKLIKEIRSRPIMITFLSQNYFNSAACRYESSLFKEFYGTNKDYSKRHIFIDLDNIMAKYTDGDSEFGPNNNSTINGCISECDDETDRKWVQSLYRQILVKNSIVLPFFEESQEPAFCDPLSFDFPEQKSTLISKCRKLRTGLRKLIADPKLKARRSEINHHIHISAGNKDIYEAVEVTKLLWPKSLITSPPYISVVSGEDTSLLKLKIAEEEYLSNCDQHIMFVSSPQDEGFILTTIKEFRRATQSLVRIHKNNIILIANDNDGVLKRTMGQSDDPELRQIEVEHISDTSADSIISFLNNSERWGPT
jgi:hypothetical protein